MSQQQHPQEQEQATSGLEVDVMADSKRKTANLLNPSDILYNMEFNTGSNPPAFVYSDTLNCSNYIPVTAGTYLRILNNVAVGNWFYEFDANKNYLRTKAPGAGAPMEISVDASYIAFNISNTTDINNYMFARTSTPLPYEPYGWLHSLRKLTTSTDTITTLPADIYADGNNATVGLKGNTVQNGTPTPDNPIMPQSCGERTGNLWNEEYPNISGTIRYIPLYVGEGSFTLSTTTPYDSSVANLFLLSGNVSTGASTSGNGVWKNHNVTTQSVDGYVTIAYRRYPGTTSPVDCQTMLNTGSTPLPYEIFGYKIPISSANTTTPVYLGEVQSTRRIKKYVFDGTENWAKGDYPPSGSYQFGIPKNVYFPDAKSTISNGETFCTHFINRQIAGGIAWEINFNIYMLISDLPEDATADDFKAFLAAQYAAGTPVTIWYILATEETGIVNEPLMKIDDYADTVSSITIPTTTSKDTFDVDTTLKPSEVSLSYTGWHDATVEEWDGSQWNE